MKTKTKLLSIAIVFLIGTSAFSILPHQAKSVTSDPVGYWKFDEGSGTIAHDSSGNGNDGALINSTQWVTGVSGSALSFDGQSSYVNVPDSQSLRPSGNAVTVDLWFKPTLTLDNSTPASLFIQKGNSYAFWINMPPQQPTPNGKIGFIVSTDSPYYNGHWIESTTNQWLAGTWYHIVGTYDGSSLKIYVNGKLENSVALTGTYLTSDSYSLAIAAYDMAAGWRPWFFNGAIDEAKIYNYARTAQDILNDYNPGRQTEQFSIWMQWWFWTIVGLGAIAVVFASTTFHYMRKPSSSNQTRVTPSKLESKTNKVCPNCGANLPADSKFCGKCGTSLD